MPDPAAAEAITASGSQWPGGAAAPAPSTVDQMPAAPSASVPDTSTLQSASKYGGETADRRERARPGDGRGPGSESLATHGEDRPARGVEHGCRAVRADRRRRGRHGRAGSRHGRRGCEARAGVRALAHLEAHAVRADADEERAAPGGGEAEARRNRGARDGGPGCEARTRCGVGDALAAERARRGVDARAQQRTVARDREGARAVGFLAVVDAPPAQADRARVAVEEPHAQVRLGAGRLLGGAQGGGKRSHAASRYPPRGAESTPERARRARPCFASARANSANRSCAQTW